MDFRHKRLAKTICKPDGQFSQDCINSSSDVKVGMFVHFPSRWKNGVQIPSEAQKMPRRLWQWMRDFEKPLNDNKCPMRDLQANSGHCGIVVYTYSTRSTGCAESVIFNVNKFRLQLYRCHLSAVSCSVYACILPVSSSHCFYCFHLCSVYSNSLRLHSYCIWNNWVLFIEHMQSVLILYVWLRQCQIIRSKQISSAIWD